MQCKYVMFKTLQIADIPQSTTSKLDRKEQIAYAVF